MTDQVTFQLLVDPVFVRGYIVSRATALTQLEHAKCDFWNSPMTIEDIIPMPELAVIVKNYDSFRIQHQ